MIFASRSGSWIVFEVFQKAKYLLAYSCFVHTPKLKRFWVIKYSSDMVGVGSAITGMKESWYGVGGRS